MNLRLTALRAAVLAVTACVPAEEPEQEVATFY